MRFGSWVWVLEENGSMGNFEDLVLPYSFVVCRFDEDVVALHFFLISGMFHFLMNLRISFLLRLDESLSHFLRMEMEGFFELRKPLPLAFRVNYQGWLFILASHTLSEAEFLLLSKQITD